MCKTQVSCKHCYRPLPPLCVSRVVTAFPSAPSQVWYTRKRNGSGSGTSCSSWRQASRAHTSARTGALVGGKFRVTQSLRLVLSRKATPHNWGKVFIAPPNCLCSCCTLLACQNCVNIPLQYIAFLLYGYHTNLRLPLLINHNCIACGTIMLSVSFSFFSGIYLWKCLGWNSIYNI